MMVREILGYDHPDRIGAEIMDAASSAGDKGTNDIVNAFMHPKEKVVDAKSFCGNEK